MGGNKPGKQRILATSNEGKRTKRQERYKRGDNIKIWSEYSLVNLERNPMTETDGDPLLATLTVEMTLGDDRRIWIPRN